MFSKLLYDGLHLYSIQKHYLSVQNVIKTAIAIERFQLLTPTIFVHRSYDFRH